MSLRAALLAFTLVASAHAALAADPAKTTLPKTTLNVGMAAQDVGRLDPHFAVSTIDRVVVAWMFNGLVRFKPGSTDPASIEPDLAERWDSSPDKRVWTFHLRRGVQFHAGFGELTAADVVFSIRKAADPKTSAFSADFASVADVEALDPYTVRITLKQTVPSLLGLLTNYSGGFIVSKKAVEARGGDFARNPVGTGPFQFASLTPNQSLELAANPDYFRGKPHLERISYRFLPSNASRDLAFQGGEIDLEYGLQDQTWVNRTKDLPHVLVDVFEPGELGELHLNRTQPPLDDPRVRQAVAYAVDRAQMRRWQGADVTREGQSVIPRGDLGFTADNGLPGHDLARAKALLAEAGHKDGVTIKVVQTQLPSMLSAMQVIQAQLKKAGINLDFQVVEHATFHQMIRKDQSALVYYAAARFPVADVYLTQFFHSRSTVGTPTAVTNFSHCDAADAEIDAARTEPDEEKQTELWQAAQRKIVAQACAVPVLEVLQAWARRDSLDYGYDLQGSMSLGPMITEQTRFK